MARCSAINMQRRRFLNATAATVAAFALSARGASAAPSLGEQFAALEKHTGGRLGVFAIDTVTGRGITHRSNERFPMCSTFKLLATAAVLARVDAGHEKLDRHVPYTKADLLKYAPVTTNHVGDGFMTVGALCRAAMEYSDNTAANLLVGTLGGPKAVTRFARKIGDPITRLDRLEPIMSTAMPGEVRDTTTPAAMARDMRGLLSGNLLAPASRGQLISWLVAGRTGGDCIRAGVLKSWRVGDKTGSGDHGTRNDIAIQWPPKRRPLIITAYLTGAIVSPSDRDAALASVGRIAGGHFARFF